MKTRVPRILFKYQPPQGIKYLRGKTVLFNLASKFNDPLELLPNVLHDGNKANSSSKIYDSLLNERIFNHKILSLTEHPDSVSMWAYYAKSNEGFVLGFHSNAALFKECDLRRVEYNTVRPWDYLESISKEKLPLLVREAITDTVIWTKSNEWLHEKEWRAVFRETNPKHSKKAKVHHYETNAIAEIRIGCRMSCTNLREIQEVLASPGYGNIKIKLQRVGLKEFRYDPLELTPEQFEDYISACERQKKKRKPRDIFYEITPHRRTKRSLRKT